MALRLFLTAFATGVCLVLFLLITAATVFKSEPGSTRATLPEAPDQPTPTLQVGADIGPSPEPRVTEQLQVQVTVQPLEPSPTVSVPEPSPTSAPVTQPPESVVPVPPGGLSAAYSQGQGVVLNWQPASGAGYYNVYRSQVPGGGPGATYLALGSSGVPSYVDATAQAGQAYYYVVTASSGGIESAPSNEASVQVP